MFRLTREVRFAINAVADDQLQHRPANSFGGFPALTGVSVFFAAQVTLAGALDPQSQYVINIQEIDAAVRDFLGDQSAISPTSVEPTQLLRDLSDHLVQRWGGRVESVSLTPTPYLTVSIRPAEQPMMRLSQKFEFSAAHRLHNPKLSDEENRRLFGKCNNPLGHGHNYEVQVTLTCDAEGGLSLAGLPNIERMVDETVIRRFDHKHLNLEVDEFKELIPTVENIARVIYRLLKPNVKLFGDGHIELAAVTVWETPKTWCEYSE